MSEAELTKSEPLMANGANWVFQIQDLTLEYRLIFK